MKRTLGWLGSLALVAATGCGSDPSTIETEEAAIAAFTLLSQQAGRASQGIPSNGMGPNGSATMNCVDGGTVDITVSSSTSTTNPRASSATATYQGSFNACAASGSTMEGDISQSATARKDGTTVTFSTSLEGTITFAGDIDGVCYMNISVNSASASAADTKISGTICGFPAQDIYSSLTTN